MGYTEQNFLKTSIKAALDAGKAILKVYNEDFKVEIKSDLSPVTLADKQAHEIILSELSIFDLPILSEEGLITEYNQRKNWKTFFLIDPLDGTKEFINKNNDFTVNIALIKNGVPISGVIFTPATNELFFAAENIGSYKISDATLINHEMSFNEIIELSLKLPLNTNNKKFTVVSSRSHINLETESFINKIKEEKGDIEIISRGSSLKLCMIAEGIANIYPRYGRTMEWDIAAGNAIVKYSGGKVINAETGKEIIYNKPDLSNPFFIASR